MHLQPRPKSASNAQSSSAAFRGLYSPYGFLPEKVQGDNTNKPVVKLLGEHFDPQKTLPQQTIRPHSHQRPHSGCASSRALVPASNFSHGNSNFKNSTTASMMRIETLEMELESSQEELALEHEVVTELEGVIDQLRLEALDLKEQLKSKSWAMVERQRNLKEAEYKNEVMAEEGEAIIEELKTECSAGQVENKELREIISSWERRWEEAEHSMDQSEERGFEATKKVQNLESLLHESTEELLKTKSFLEEKTNENAGLRKRNSELENQIVALSKIARIDVPDQTSNDRMSSLMEQVSEELRLLRADREERSISQKERGGKVSDELDEADWTSLGGGGRSVTNIEDIGEAISESLSRRLPSLIAEQLKDPLTQSVVEAVRQQPTTKKDRTRVRSNSRNTEKETHASSSSPGVNEATGSDSRTRKALPSLDGHRNVMREEVNGSNETLGSRISADKLNRGVSDDDDVGGDGASTVMTGGNQVPDEDTQLSMRGAESYRGSKAGDDGDGFTLADGLTLNDGITIGDGFGDIIDNQDQTIDTNMAAHPLESFDRRNYPTTTGSIGSPSTNQGGGGGPNSDFDDFTGRGERRRGSRHHPASCRSVESGLSVNSSALPQGVDVDFDDGNSAAESTYIPTNYYDGAE